MEDEDALVRITLRLPKDVHEALTKEAARKPDSSLNKEIVDRLDASLSENSDLRSAARAARRALSNLTAVAGEIEDQARISGRRAGLYRALIDRAWLRLVGRGDDASKLFGLVPFEPQATPEGDETAARRARLNADRARTYGYRPPSGPDGERDDKVLLVPERDVPEAPD